MIKRLGALLLIMLYTVTVSGFALNLHYCGKLLASVKLEVPSKSCLKSDGSKMKCCKDKQITVKVKDAHQNATFNFLAKTFVFDVPKSIFNDAAPAQQTIHQRLLYSAAPHAPPDKVPVFVKNCTFLI